MNADQRDHQFIIVGFILFPTFSSFDQQTWQTCNSPFPLCQLPPSAAGSLVHIFIHFHTFTSLLFHQTVRFMWCTFKFVDRCDITKLERCVLGDYNHPIHCRYIRIFGIPAFSPTPFTTFEHSFILSKYLSFPLADSNRTRRLHIIVLLLGQQAFPLGFCSYTFHTLPHLHFIHFLHTSIRIEQL